MLNSILAISAGASAGAVLRWLLGRSLNTLFPAIPPGTLAANLIGGYLIGIAVAVFTIQPNLAPEWRLLIITGFLGGLTTFSTFSAEVMTLLQQNRTHRGRSLAKWLLEEARSMGIGGATLIPAAEGFGHDRKLRSAYFFELTDQPLEVTMAVSAADAKRLFARLQEEGVNIFYVQTPIEFGMSGER